MTGRDGALYFAERNSLVITRMTTAGTITRRSPLPNSDEFPDPVALVPTRYGLAISERFAGIAGMSYAGAFVRHNVQTKSIPDVMTLGPDGNLWYASSNEPSVGRLELSLGR